jgi:hypothetical protein
VNLCRACREDFGSTSAFDAHRVGKHAYTYRDGLGMDPSREDGRRCLDAEELERAGWHRDKQGRWRQPMRNTAGLLAMMYGRSQGRTPARGSDSEPASPATQRGDVLFV